MLRIKKSMVKLLTTTVVLVLAQLLFMTVSMAKPVTTDLGIYWEIHGINNRGQILGGSCIWENGIYTSLGVGGAYKINDKGEVIGDSAGHGYIWKNGKITDLGTLGGTTSSAKGLNENGQVVGESYTADGTKHAFLWGSGKMTDLGTLGGSSSWAKDINEKGQIIGESYISGDKVIHAFIWEDGKMTDLGGISGLWEDLDVNSYVTGINDLGQIIGYLDAGTQTPNGVGMYILKGFIWENGKMTDLGELYEEWPWTMPIGINNKGQVTGESMNGVVAVGFIWENGKMTNLGLTTSQMIEICGINDKGQIAGSNINNRNAYPFIWENGVSTKIGEGWTFAKGINNKGQVYGNTQNMDPNISEHEIRDFLWEDIPNIITPSKVKFDPLNPADIIIKIDEDSGKLLGVRNGTAELTSLDYSISGSEVTINKSYLEALFSDHGVKSLPLIFDFENDNDPVLAISRVIIPNAVGCDNPFFDTSNPQDIKVNISGSAALKAIKKYNTPLTKADYSISGNVVTINKSYILNFYNGFENHELELTFDFEDGDDPVFKIPRTPIYNYILCENRVFDKSNPQDIKVNVSGSAALKAIKINVASLTYGVDYSISGDIVTINKSYLTYYFNKFTEPWVKLNLVFDFDNYNDPLFTVTPALITNYITCESPVFDKSNPQDIKVNISGNTLKGIKINEASLIDGVDYRISDNVVTIKKSYLTYYFNKFTEPWVKLNLVFDFEKGNDPLFTATKK